MKIKTKEYTRTNNMFSYLIMTSITKEALDTVIHIEGRNGETEHEIILTFNGVELDVSKFAEKLENAYLEDVELAAKKAAVDKAEELFEKWKHHYESTNSSNAKLEKLKEQFNKVTNMLSNIDKGIKDIK